MNTILASSEKLGSFRTVDDVSLQLQLLLGDLTTKLKSGNADRAITAIVSELTSVRRSVNFHRWKTDLIPLARAHEAFSLVMECPFTSHAFKRPRGYPGDAGLLDIIYEHPAASDAIRRASPMGLSILTPAVQVGSSRAVRFRREIIADKVSQEVRRHDGLRVLSLACGHLREFELLAEVERKGVAEYAALDHDADSLAVVGAYGGCVRPLKISVKDVLVGRCKLDKYHFVYSAGLYDYLDAATSQRLTRSLFDMLLPGGKLMIANFLKDIEEQAYMEMFMRWDLIYRVQAEIEAFAGCIADEHIGTTRYFEDATRHIGYLEIGKNG